MILYKKPQVFVDKEKIDLNNNFLKYGKFELFTIIKNIIQLMIVKIVHYDTWREK